MRNARALLFALAFLLLAVERVVLAVRNPSDEMHYLVYTVRLAAFFVLAVAIWDRNRRKP